MTLKDFCVALGDKVQHITYDTSQKEGVTLSDDGLTANVYNVQLPSDSLFTQSTYAMLPETLLDADMRGLDVSKMSNLQKVFAGCCNMTTVDISNWDTSNVTSFLGMFITCNSLETIKGIEKLNTSKLVLLCMTFYACTALKTLDGLENWDVSNVTNLSCAFKNCSKVTSLEPIKNWDTSKVTDLESTFSGCGMTSLEPIRNWNTSNVTTISSIFTNCANLTNVDEIKDWDLSNCTSTVGAFSGCSNLVSVNLENWVLPKNGLIFRMFEKCPKLKYVYIPNLSTSSLTSTSKRKLFYNDADTKVYTSKSFNSELIATCGGTNIKQITETCKMYLGSNQLKQKLNLNEAFSFALGKKSLELNPFED